ncbi:hypothetical protein MFLAVUS_009778 [Mucor flavus]|uniref:Major facilitator superfamily (MFS) profile domain-containing protein n=1 Tax=Mucor flavus TaxID=439312 RepID=A0ABP9ZAY3_9FUNG
MMIEQISKQCDTNTAMEYQNQLSSITIVENQSDTPLTKIPYSVFSPGMKIMIVTTVSLSSFFSSFSSNIYYPALKNIEDDLHINETMVNLTITVFMIFQACTQNYPMLLMLRMVQAFGSGSAAAISAGSIGDITLPSERGGYIGITSMGTTLGPLVGPTLGGIISYNLGWRWIFWVLAIIALPLWLVHVFILPETLRSLVGDGSGYANPTPSQLWRRSREIKCTLQQQQDEEKNETSVQRQSEITLQSTLCQPEQAPTRNRFLSFPNPFQSLIFLKEKDVAVLLAYNAFQYVGVYCVVTSLTGLLTSTYGLNSFQVGMCYLPNGFGAIIGSFLSGRALDRQFKNTAKSLGNFETQVNRHNIDLAFPIEKARMGTAWICGLIFSLSMIGYGWCFHFKSPIAIPIILTFILSGVCSMIFNGTSTLLVDLFPDNSAAIIASNNLTRCLLGAGCILIVQPGIKYMGVGWFFTAFSVFLLLTTPLLLIELKCGSRWRAERKQSQEKVA